MIKKFINSILFILLFVFVHNGIIAQSPARTILSLRGSTLSFNNGDTLSLTSLKNSESQLIILVFHAEEDTIGLDPGLSVNGRWRAIHLNKLFKDIDFKGYFTTPFRNNILTLQPLMDTKQSKCAYYDQADLKALTENIHKVFPFPVIVMVHPQTVSLIFEQLTHKKWTTTLDGNLSEKIILIQKAKSIPSTWNEFNYSIR